MSLFSSLYTGVNGMNAQTQSTASISTNIANMTTIGYKKSDTVFHDLVVNNTQSARFANGGVLSKQVQRVDIQGALQQIQNSTSMGISGNGFFAVKSNDDPALQFLYTRNGTFTPDVNGVLRNEGGFVLYAWPVDANGNVSSSPTTSSLVPADVNELDSAFRTTTAANLTVNLNAAQEPFNTQILGQPLPVNNQPVHFARSITVYDGLGQARDITFEYRKITGPMASATSQTPGLDFLTSLTDPAIFPGISAGNSFTVSSGAGTQEYIIGAPAGAGQVRVNTIGELTNHINGSLGGGNAVTASINENGNLVFQANDPAVNLDFTETAGTPLSGIGSLALPALSFAPEVALNGGALYPNQADFPAFSNITDPNTHGWWEVNITTADPADPNNPALPRVPITTGMVNFNSDGSMNAIPAASGNREIVLNNINFDSASGTEETSITVNTNFSQFTGDFNVLSSGQNGAAAGTLNGVTITREGLVVASFSNGQTLEIFQVPLATFVNPNGLRAMSGTVFSQSQDSGDLIMNAAGTGGSGIIEAATVENSNVDLADEFANLIVSQRAFSANSRVVNTVDEMTAQLKQLKS
ncbi:MAG: hypothetical protein CO093_01365 [Alphaproteobacteria bacterium CG_4_9_14_3_um_filter_47_13]|nr:MAG: hypothetical protein CO093_01365 [Alphaproteobacteria bacterium CG_4_9_14_3_um_filter_47_13]